MTMQMTDRASHSFLDDDVLKGTRAIAEFLGEPEHAAHRLLARRVIPAGKIGGRWFASRSALEAYFRDVATGRARAAMSNDPRPAEPPG